MANQMETKPGKTKIVFKQWWAGLDFGEYMVAKAGEVIEVDTDKMKEVQAMHGKYCPFDVVTSNKSMGSSPEEK